MKPVAFKQQNMTWAEHQPEYEPLPAYSDGTHNITCWRLTWWERIKLLFTGIVWCSQMHFGEALQPQRLDTVSPFITKVTI